jgi:hypothetical protein
VERTDAVQDRLQLRAGKRGTVGRLLQPIGNIPPAEAEARYYAMINEQKLAA